MTEKEKQIYNAAKNNFNSWPKWKQEYASNFMYSYKDEPEPDKTYTDKAILVINMPNCCDECFALDEYGDYPLCRITQEQRGYNFRTRENRMDKCPLKPAPEKMSGNDSIYYQWGDYEDGWNHCIDSFLGD